MHEILCMIIKSYIKLQASQMDGLVRASPAVSPNFCLIFACLENEQWHLAFSYPLFQIHFPTDSLSHSLSHLNIISSFILYSFFIIIYSFYIHYQQLYFQWKVLYSQYFSQYFHKNHIKILCEKLLLVLIWTHHWNYIFTHQY